MTITPEIKKAEILNCMPVSAKNAVECKLPIAEEDVSSVIFASARAVLGSAECTNGEIRYGGKVTFYALLSGGGIKKCEAGVEFSYRQEIKELKEGDLFVGEITAENVRITSNNGIPTATATLILTGKALRKDYADYIKEVPEVCVKKCQAENLALIACDVKDFDLEEEFDVDYPINEVVWHGETLKVKSVTSGIGSVNIEGVVELSSLVLLDEGKTEYVKREVPFNFEQEIKFAYPGLIATAKASVVDANLKVVVDRAKGKSSIAVILKVCARTCVYENEAISYVSDAYSESNHLFLERAPLKVDKILGETVIEKRVLGGEIAKFEKSTLLVCPIFAKIEESEVVCENGLAKLNGVARVGALVCVDGSHLVETALVPFEVECDEACDKLSINRAEITSVDFSLVGDSLSVEFTVCVAVEKTVSSLCGFVVKVECGEERVKSNSAISVFIPNKNDTLWDVAKTLGIKEEEILKTNGDLAFPLTGEERIVIYREI
ncbi:MAG: hypothetical protein IJA97_00465 [Clostridia bacterium]|nr:hypothetical protein [Clostridia bacterium]